MKKEKSCGIVVFQDDKVLLIKHNMGHWGIPKGHVEDFETEEETAMREVFEETGISATIIDGFKEKITYSPTPNVEKDVYFFVGETKEENLTPQLSEVSTAQFIELKKAVETITYLSEKELLNKAIHFYKKLKS